MIEIILQAERALSVGLVEQAEKLYRQAAAADARNSIAVVGLARVALERADDRAAYSLGKRALEIDPENAAASRLVERLEEVMRFRNETPPDGAEVMRVADAALTGSSAVVAEPVAEVAAVAEVAGAGVGEPAGTVGAEPPAASAPPTEADAEPPVEAPWRRSLLDRLLRRPGRPG
jgi:hypothetical protein